MAAVTFQMPELDLFLKQIEQAAGNIEPALNKALKAVGDQVARDTKSAMASSNLPAGGKYSIGATEQTIITNPSVTWDADGAWIGVGFDQTTGKFSAGTFLIAGTPRMKPDKKLRAIYKDKKYMATLQDALLEELGKSLVARMEG